MFDLDYATSPTPIPCGRHIADLRARIAECRAKLAALEVELVAALLARGSRPGDGSDQTTLFDVAEPNLFGGM